MVASALRWLTDFKLDGLRLDAVHHLTTEGQRSLAADLADPVAELGDATFKRWLIGELSPQDPANLLRVVDRGLGLDLARDFWVGRHLRDFVRDGASPDQRRQALWGLLAHHADPEPERWVSAFLDHDVLGNTPT